MRRLALVGVILAALAWPTASLASNLGKSGATITYTAAVTEANNLTVTVSGTNFLFSEAAVNGGPGSDSAKVDIRLDRRFSIETLL